MAEIPTNTTFMDEMAADLQSAYHDISHLESLLTEELPSETAGESARLMSVERKERLADWAASTAVARWNLSGELADNADTYGSFLVISSGPTVQRLSEIAVAGKQILEQTLPPSEQAA